MASRIVVYYRLSIGRSARSQADFDAQKTAVSAYEKANRCAIIGIYIDLESAKRERQNGHPELRSAIDHARRAKAMLVIAKLDRLSRSHMVTSELLRSDVNFVCCDNEFANRSSIKLLASLAEDETRRSGARIKAALAAYKQRGGRLGAARPQCRNLTAAARRKGAAAAAAKHRQNADEFYFLIRNLIMAQRKKGRSLQRIAIYLNGLGKRTRRGKAWNAMQIKRVLDRQLGLD